MKTIRQFFAIVVLAILAVTTFPANAQKIRVNRTVQPTQKELLTLFGGNLPEGMTISDVAQDENLRRPKSYDFNKYAVKKYTFKLEWNAKCPKHGDFCTPSGESVYDRLQMKDDPKQQKKTLNPETFLNVQDAIQIKARGIRAFRQALGGYHYHWWRSNEQDTYYFWGTFFERNTHLYVMYLQDDGSRLVAGFSRLDKSYFGGREKALRFDQSVMIDLDDQ